MAEGRPATMAEKAAPEAAQCHWHHRYRSPGQNHVDTGLEGIDFAIFGEFAFRENTHHMAGFEFFINAVESGFINLRHLRLRANGDSLGQPEETAHDRCRENVV